MQTSASEFKSAGVANTADELLSFYSSRRNSLASNEIFDYFARNISSLADYISQARESGDQRPTVSLALECLTVKPEKAEKLKFDNNYYVDLNGVYVFVNGSKSVRYDFLPELKDIINQKKQLIKVDIQKVKEFSEYISSGILAAKGLILGPQATPLTPDSKGFQLLSEWADTSAIKGNINAVYFSPIGVLINSESQGYEPNFRFLPYLSNKNDEVRRIEKDFAKYFKSAMTPKSREQSFLSSDLKSHLINSILEIPDIVASSLYSSSEVKAAELSKRLDYSIESLKLSSSRNRTTRSFSSGDIEVIESFLTNLMPALKLFSTGLEVSTFKVEDSKNNLGGLKGLSMGFFSALATDAEPKYFETPPTKALNLHKATLSLSQTDLEALKQEPTKAKQLIIKRFAANLMSKNQFDFTNLGQHFYAAVKDVLADALAQRQAVVDGFVPAANYAFSNLICEYLSRCGSSLQSARAYFPDKIAAFLDDISAINGNGLQLNKARLPEVSDDSPVIDI